MNKYIFVLIVCAVVFLICFLIDTLFKLIFRNRGWKRASRSSVRREEAR